MFSALQPITDSRFPLLRNTIEEDISPQCSYSVPVWRGSGSAVITSIEWAPILPADTTLWLQVLYVLDCVNSDGVLIANIADVREYLFQHKDIVNLTLRACRRAKEVFESEAGSQLVLELERDPEFNCEHLNILVRLQTYNESIWEKIEKVSVEFEYEMAGKSGWILITTDYRRPQ
jgi:hypothetical protein